jgi:predicted nucleotidyltransferase
MNTVHPHLSISREQLSDFCKRWRVKEFALFGSVVREDFRPDSDIDVLVDFLPGARLGFWDFVHMKFELEELLERPVDLVKKGTIRNPYRRASIDKDLQVVYAA